jgi:hypothetical protein
MTILRQNLKKHFTKQRCGNAKPGDNPVYRIGAVVADWAFASLAAKLSVSAIMFGLCN